MSLTIIAMTGILVGFLCLVIGFFLEETDPRDKTATVKDKRVRAIRKRVVAPRRKAA